MDPTVAGAKGVPGGAPEPPGKHNLIRTRLEHSTWSGFILVKFPLNSTTCNSNRFPGNAQGGRSQLRCNGEMASGGWGEIQVSEESGAGKDLTGRVLLELGSARIRRGAELGL